MSRQIKRQVTFGMGFILITSFILKLPPLPTVFLSEDLIVFTSDSREQTNISTKRQSEQSPQPCFLTKCSFLKVKATHVGMLQTARLSNSTDNSCSTGTAELTSTRA